MLRYLLPNRKAISALIAGKFYLKNVIGKIVELIKKKIFQNCFFFLIILFLFFIDRASKNYILNFFLDQKIDTYYINSILNFTLIWNSGIAFGLFKGDGFSYNLMSLFILCIILFLFVCLIQSKDKFEKFNISLVIGGALGNFYDRFFFNAVPDFIDLHYLDFHWFIFNVADIIITFGIILLLLSNIFIKKNV